ncbi:MAG TPA: patatin-like phospholipase family protein [Bryobacteraceae bacterium]
MTTALVLSAGGMYAAWEVGVWRALAAHVRPDIIIGASAGAWNGWAIAGGATQDDLAREWLDSSLAAIRILHPQPLYQKARDLWSRYQPRTPFALTLVEMPRLRPHLIRGADITWRHLAATASIPGLFPAVSIGGRSYVDGGFRGALPLWAAAELGATHVIAVDCLAILRWQIVRKIISPRRPLDALKVTSIVPSEPFGQIKYSVIWSRERVERWIELGERDGRAALPRLQ